MSSACLGTPRDYGLAKEPAHQYVAGHNIWLEVLLRCPLAPTGLDPELSTRVPGYLNLPGSFADAQKNSRLVPKHGDGHVDLAQAGCCPQ